MNKEILNHSYVPIGQNRWNGERKLLTEIKVFILPIELDSNTVNNQQLIKLEANKVITKEEIIILIGSCFALIFFYMLFLKLKKRKNSFVF